MKFRLAAAILLVGGTIANSADWPAWRGTGGQGHCEEKNLPLKWSKTENVKWRVTLDEPGNSTPVVLGEKIFFTQANKGGTTRGTRCISRQDGKQLWKQDIAYDAKERNWNPSWYCNASPVTDGERVVVSYASAGMYCYDMDGKELWKRTDLGRFEHQYGNGSSPIIHGDLAILWCGPNEDPKDRNYLLAVDKKTGKTVWEHDEKGGSWGTPLIVQVGKEEQLLLGVPKTLKSFNPKTGKELWHCDGLTELVYTSVLFDGKDIAVSMSGYGGAALAVKLGGEGDITKNRLWHHPKNTQRVGSGVIVGKHAYILEENCMPHCYELLTGKEVWQAENKPQGSTWSSMVAADGKLYVMTKQGDTYVFAADPKYQLLATNRLGEPTNCSIAISNGELFIRTDKAMWCIAEKKQ